MQIYNKDFVDIKFIGSSSKGNCYLFNDSIMVDCGMSYKKLEPYLHRVKVIFISHEHKDHINIETLKKIKHYYPHIKIFLNRSTSKKFGADVEHNIISTGQMIQFTHNNVKYQIVPIQLYHDVENHGFCIKYTDLSTNQELVHFHGTDTSTLDKIVIPECDIFTLECNHIVEIVEENIRLAKEQGKYYKHLLRSLDTHLATFKALTFGAKYGKPGYLFIPAHTSEKNFDMQMFEVEKRKYEKQRI